MSAAKTSSIVSSIEFPDPRMAMAEGIVAVGGQVDVGTLLAAYRKGIFPWPHPDYPTLWFCPDRRGILRFEDFHIPKSLLKFIKKTEDEFSFTINQNFEAVIEACQAQNRKGQDGTWILPSVRKGYSEFHRAGYAYSIEVWRNQKIVGGLYGVLVDGVFSGESMFHRTDNASKLAVIYTVQWLKQQGHKWIDIQMVTPLLELFGGKYVSRDYYLKLLAIRQKQHRKIDAK